jgi:nucleoside-diphosphate-sugar epimerase
LIGLTLALGWTGFINGFFEVVIARVCTWDLEKEVVTVVGKGTAQYPWVFVHDIGRTVAATLKAPPNQFKDRWVLSTTVWASVNEIADWVEEAAGKKLRRDYASPGTDMPIVTHLEEHGGNIFDRNATTDLALEWADLKGYIQSLVKTS